MMQHTAPRKVYGITKTEYAQMVNAAEASTRQRSNQGFFARLKKRFN